MPKIEGEQSTKLDFKTFRLYRAKTYGRIIKIFVDLKSIFTYQYFIFFNVCLKNFENFENRPRLSENGPERPVKKFSWVTIEKIEMEKIPTVGTLGNWDGFHEDKDKNPSIFDRKSEKSQIQEFLMQIGPALNFLERIQ